MRHTVFILLLSCVPLAALAEDGPAERPIVSELVILRSGMRSGGGSSSEGQVTSLRCNQRPSRPEVCRAMRITGETVEKSAPVDPKTAHALLEDSAKRLAPFAGKPAPGGARTLRWRLTWQGKTFEGTMDENAQKPVLEALLHVEKGLSQELNHKERK